MNGLHDGRWAKDGIHADLVGYLVVVVPEPSSLAAMVPALRRVVETGMIRLLDVVVLQRDVDGAIEVSEVETVPSLSGLGAIEGEVGGLLSEHDLELASFALPSGSCGIVLLTEELWARPLSQAAREVGGQIVAGERIPPVRVEGALARRPPEPSGGG